MKNMIIGVALLLVGNVPFASAKGPAKHMTIDKAMTCFVKALKPEAFNAAWTNGGKATFMGKVKGNENMPVLGDQLVNLVSKYMNDAAFSPAFFSMKEKWMAEADAANTEKTVARAFWSMRQNIIPDMLTEKGSKKMAKYEGEIRALAS